MKVREGFAKAFSPRKGRAKTVSMARDFCVLQAVCCIAAVVFASRLYWTYAMLAVLVQLFEWRFFSLSLRLRRYEEKGEC